MYFLFLFGIEIGRMYPRRIGTSTWVAIVLAITMVVKGVRGGVYSDEWELNGVDHHHLCEVFKATAELWEASRQSEMKLDSGLEAALRQALFSNVGKKDLASITEAVPAAYRPAKPVHRGTWCGSCKNSERYYPGRSITHDLMCLCSAGYYGNPFYGFYLFFFKETGFKLCGRERKDMIKDRHHGWYAYNGYGLTKGLDKPWRTIVWGCVNSREKTFGTGIQDLTAKVKKLSGAMKNFTAILKVVNGRYKLGGFQGHTESDGSSETNMHVLYDTCDDKKKPWWKRLNETLTSKTPEQLLVPRKTQSPSSEPSEELNDGPEEELLEGFAGEEGLEPESSTADGGSAPQVDTENATQIQGPTNSTESTVIPLNATASGNSSHPRLEYLRSGSHINQPLLFLGAIFLI
ncbi:Variant surface glycoprotein [Trypanosoma congolense IL3000]|uniref:Variant surface glycoprotein n=1 Tax=Trypanosoma congolense (strain IL3000) TaxID=1068625 RepID=F9WEY4_TRYCI|nr:Variant surface glycoprotein [Trypanosoma congolense IL3000]